ncbi:hypothetical protein HN51_060912 [Arachis hypogaea]|uniref:RimM N-terminal domain-containing protein n=1 Tax=Arachis hypogaea TaxID=3818 RepID=A0A444ZRE5_ARAHY|nr:uncharacterized protein LOC112735016 isoform X2 [Arachis hypogaea]XP_025691909.1 uncharacterized protein LOC112792770 isoform X2 [Arachis hypogaea]QHO04379.1 Ribosome maturation factor RimM [Arachis hypogaea]RYR16746.1 hypothetical protein Ahy_B03g061653 isoform B [Arachis hypogaea]
MQVVPLPLPTATLRTSQRPSSALLPSLHLPFYPSSLPTNTTRLFLPPLHSATATPTPTQEPLLDTPTNESTFIDIGYISSVHGLHGELRVKPTTDFPQLRFSTPGRRWLRQKVLNAETLREVELEEGREHPALKSWILKFKGIDSVDQAKMLIGATLLVTEEDKPDLEEGEFYTHDLVGMRVFLKESRELVGTVINVFNSGANDLLQVSLDSSFDILDKSGKPRSAGTEASDQLVLVPFVEAIVPDVDMERREMHITPPKGLLELNLRYDERSKKERRQLEWKERKKFSKQLIAVKKKLVEMEQQHVFHGLRYGEKEQRRLLSGQIVDVNSKLLQEALQSLEQPIKRWNMAELVRSLEAKLISSLEISAESFVDRSKKLVGDMRMQEKGLTLMSKGKMAIVLLLSEIENQDCIRNPGNVETEATESSPLTLLQKLLCNHETFVEDRVSVPLILVSSAEQIQPLTTLFTNNHHFGFDSEKVWFLEEEKLPVISSLPEGENKYKILMKSPWEILQAPAGSGAFISLFSKHNIMDNLINMGVEYIEVCCPSGRIAGGNSLLLGLVRSRGANIGIQISHANADALADSDKNVDMIFSVDFVNKLLKESNILQFDATEKANSYVEKVDKEWVTVTSSTPNSFELSCNIYSSLNACPLDKVCVLQVRE